MMRQRWGQPRVVLGTFVCLPPRLDDRSVARRAARDVPAYDSRARPGRPVGHPLAAALAGLPVDSLGLALVGAATRTSCLR